jgi:hypothetical protein
MGNILVYCHRKGPAGRVRFFGSGTNAEKGRSRGNRWYIGSQPRGKMEIPAKCIECGAAISSKAKFCSECGALQTMKPEWNK